MMKRISSIGIVFISAFFLHSFPSCTEELNQQTEFKYFSKVIAEEYSPNKQYRFKVGELNDSVHPSTQLIVYFDNCGGSAYNPKGWNLGIKVYWKGNDTIVVEGKNYDVLVKHDFVQCHLEKVHIKYIIH